MVTENAESETPRTRTGQEECQLSTDGGRAQWTRQNGSSVQSEPLALYRNDWEGGSNLSQPGAETPGGMYEQLIEEIIEEIQESQARTEKLQQRLEKVRSLSQQAKNNLDESK